MITSWESLPQGKKEKGRTPNLPLNEERHHLERGLSTVGGEKRRRERTCPSKIHTLGEAGVTIVQIRKKRKAKKNGRISN